ncbi:MAG: hypothetical protein R3277_01335 [Brumimicrobium sp.]|nr:hypothetical protein [Brumimicrobium sp.]
MNRMKLIQATGEAIIPLAGYFFFDWNLYFILLFYFIDLIAGEVFLHLKLKKILNYQGISDYFSRTRFYAALNGLMICVIIAGVHVPVRLLYPEISFKHEFIEFLMYEEAGIPIPQGFILLPLVILGNYQQYKSNFLHPKRYRTLAYKQVTLSRRRALIFSLSGIVAGTILAYFTNLPVFSYLLALIAVKFWVDLKYTS